MDIDTSKLNLKTVEESKSKLLGVYPQKQDGLFMQRVKIFGGRITLLQWRIVAKLAELYTPQTLLHLTTREDIEYHNLSENDLPIVQQALAAGGLDTLAAGGDSVRNITVCTDCDDADGIDVYELAAFVQQHLAAEPGIFNLPRKFKISFSGCSKASAKPFINDLGFIAQQNGLFTAVGAGSLGPKPAVGIELYEDLSEDAVPALCQAAIQFFAEQGDRQNRRRARLRHVRERLGDELFKNQLDERFKKLRSEINYEKVKIKNVKQKLKMFVKLQLPNGDILPKDALTLADFAETINAELRINLSHGLELYVPASYSNALFPAIPPQLAALTKLPVVVACPGCRTCPNALTDTYATADNIRRVLLQDANLADYENISINLSGCPNDCAQAVVADIGLIGLIKTIDGKKTPCYRFLTGGGNGRTSALAKEMEIIPADSAPQHVKKIITDKDCQTAAF